MERQPTVLDATVPAGRRSAPASTGPIVQRALLVGRADDPSEREADRIADVVVGSLDTIGATRTSAGVSRIRRSAQTDRLGGSSADADTDPAIRSQTGAGAALPTGSPAGSGRRSAPTWVMLRSTVTHGIRRYHTPADPTKAWKKRENADNELFVDIHALRQWVNEGAVKDGDTDDDRRLRNSCNWILAGKAKLFAVVPTGDTDDRVTHQGQDPKVQHVLFPRPGGQPRRRRDGQRSCRLQPRRPRRRRTRTPRARRWVDGTRRGSSRSCVPARTAGSRRGRRSATRCNTTPT